MDDIPVITRRVVEEVVIKHVHPLEVVARHVQRFAIARVGEHVVGDVSSEGSGYGPRPGFKQHGASVLADEVVGEVKADRVLNGYIDGGDGRQIQDGHAVVFDPAAMNLHGRVDLTDVLIHQATILVVVENRVCNQVLVFAV